MAIETETIPWLIFWLDRISPAISENIPVTPATPNPGIKSSINNKTNPSANIDIDIISTLPVLIPPIKNNIKENRLKNPKTPNPGTNNSTTKDVKAKINRIVLTKGLDIKLRKALSELRVFPHLYHLYLDFPC